MMGCSLYSRRQITQNYTGRSSDLRKLKHLPIIKITMTVVAGFSYNFAYSSGYCTRFSPVSLLNAV